MRMKCLTCVSGFLLLFQAGAAQPAGLTARAVLTAQRTCHEDNEDVEEFKMDIFLTNTGAQPVVLCDIRSDVSLRNALATTAENVQAKQFLFEPNWDVFPSDTEVAREAARVKTCRKTAVPANGSVPVKLGAVSRFDGLHEIPATKSVSGPMYFTGDVDVRLPGAHLKEWRVISLDPLRIVLPPYDPSAPRPYVSRKNRCEAWKVTRVGDLLP